MSAVTGLINASGFGRMKSKGLGAASIIRNAQYVDEFADTCRGLLETTGGRCAEDEDVEGILDDPVKSGGICEVKGAVRLGVE